MTQGERILITGGEGFIGSALTSYLKKTSNYEIFSLSKKEFSLEDSEKVRKTLLDLKPKIIFHCVGGLHQDQFEPLYKTHIKCTQTLLETIKNNPFDTKIVVPGSAAEYGICTKAVDEETLPKPVNNYGLIKSWQTLLVNHYATHGIKCLVGRIFNIIDKKAPGHTLIGALKQQFDQIENNSTNTITLRNTNEVRDFLDLRDIVRALVILGKEGKPGEIYNICSQKEVTIKILYQRWAKILGVDLKLKDLSLPSKNPYSVGSNQKIIKNTTWKPEITLSQALENLQH